MKASNERTNREWPKARGLSQDAGGWEWDVQINDEIKVKRVKVSGTAMASDPGTLPPQTAETIRTEGRAVIEAYLSRGGATQYDRAPHARPSLDELFDGWFFPNQSLPMIGGGQEELTRLGSRR